MKYHLTLGAALLTAIVCSSQARAGDYPYPDDGDVHRPHFFGRLKPKGGWNPDGRGIFHWWNPHCFPRPCGPDDYCRKPMPNVCRPLTAPFDARYTDQQLPVPLPQAP